MKSLVALLLLLTLASNALASRDDPHVLVIGLLGQKALLRIDGEQHMLAVGERIGGVTVLEVTRQDTLLRINKREVRLAMGKDTGAITQRSAGASVEIGMNGYGQYITGGQINGRVVRFLVDTGANTVSLTANDARAIGLDYKRIGERVGIMTAGGNIEGWSVTLGSVQVGPITVRNVVATVRESNDNAPILLGMTFLSRVSMQHEQNRIRLTAR
ncbi:MAG: TIGR02281 family clan AA aspartic protease [Moraxellaceae bacterium]|nr:TIGR02281 family clan AA aspartic protease [Moraxellaceae bacterium]MBP9046231.1 TIGR02281 family clan AA aspartic protease [Moraxellaceae bacterium]MCC6200005.1 TIGR02281 family clan AA aspartic protease [Moraxellaceae bacterium]